MDRVLSRCIALHNKQKNVIDIKLFLKMGVDILESLDAPPNYIGLMGKGYPNKIVSFSAGIKSLERNKYDGIEAINLFYTPPSSNAPAYDWLFLIGLNMLEETRILFAGNESRLDDVVMEGIVKRLVDFTEFEYGYIFNRRYDEGPEFYVAGAIYGDLSDEECDQITAWLKDSYVKKSYALGKIRGVYNYNLLSRAHLNFELENNYTLADFISEKTKTILKKMNPFLFVWQIPENEIERVTKDLLEYEIIITK